MKSYKNIDKKYWMLYMESIPLFQCPSTQVMNTADARSDNFLSILEKY